VFDEDLVNYRAGRREDRIQIEAIDVVGHLDPVSRHVGDAAPRPDGGVPRWEEVRGHRDHIDREWLSIAKRYPQRACVEFDRGTGAGSLGVGEPGGQSTAGAPQRDAHTMVADSAGRCCLGRACVIGSLFDSLADVGRQHAGQPGEHGQLCRGQRRATDTGDQAIDRVGVRLRGGFELGGEP
jgi:hypothetical protein